MTCSVLTLSRRNDFVSIPVCVCQGFSRCDIAKRVVGRYSSQINFLPSKVPYTDVKLGTASLP